jgi:predicted PurR-regulated permease PerM
MKPIVQYLLGAAAVVIIIAGLKLGAGIINQILLAYLLTMCITPLPNWLNKKGFSKGLSILISILVIILGGFIVTVLLANSMASLVEKFPEYEARLTGIYNDMVQFAADNNFDIKALIHKANVSPDKILGFTTKIVSGLTNLLSSSFVIAMLIIFMIVEFINYTVDTRKGKREEAFHLEWITGMGGDLRKYVSITSLSGVITAVLNFILLLILGVDFAFLWAFLSFLLNFIPNIGFIISVIPPALIALLMLGGWKAFAVLIGFWLINAVTENVIRPIFMKESLNISLLVTFLSMLIWGWILGMPGAVLGVPLTLVVMKIFRDIMEQEKA